jgi:hypothetical protein
MFKSRKISRSELQTNNRNRKYFPDLARLPSKSTKNFANHIRVEKLAVQAAFKNRFAEDQENHSPTALKTYQHSDDPTTERTVKESAILHYARSHCFP